MPTATPFNNLITFSRGSNATVTGSNGLIQWAPNNLLTFSEQFDNAAAWPKTNATVTANAAIAPDGSSTADLMYPTTTGTDRRIIRSTTLTVGTVYAQSVYVKAAGKRWVYLNGIDASSAANNCWFDLQNGVVGTKGGSVLSAGISAVGDGWYRIFTVALAGANNYFYLMGVDGDNTITSTTNGTDGVLLWGAQLELGSTATTYNPTTVKNLLGFSEAFDNAAWTKLGASIVTGAQANPINGLFNAQKLMEDTANTQHRTLQSVSLAAAPYTLSAYMKAGERTWALVLNGTIANGFAYFNLSTGVVGSVGVGVTAASIISVGNGWYRCAITFTAPAGGNILEFRTASANGTASYTGDGNSGVYIYGAQLSDSASLDPYVPTPGAAPSSTAFYGPRFDFDPVTLQPRGLLVEEQRTNLLVRSEEIDNASWTKTNTTVVANNTTAPDGTLTADRVIPTVTSATHLVRQGPTTTAVVHAQTVFYKPSGYTKVAIREDFAVGQYASFSCVGAGSIINKTAAAGAEIVALQNGWYRLTLVPTTTTANQGMGVYIMADGYTTGDPAGYSYAGDGVSGGFVWGVQLEAGAFATSYIPTVASTVTRSADVATISGSLFAQWYAGGQGTFLFEGNWLKPSSGQVYVLANGSSNRYIYDGNAATPTMTVQSFDGTNVLVSNVNVNGTTKIGSSYQTAVNKAISVNGSTAATGAYDATAWSTNTALRFGEASFSGYIRNIRFIPARVADFQLQALTELPLVPTLDLDFLNNLYEA